MSTGLTHTGCSNLARVVVNGRLHGRYNLVEVHEIVLGPQIIHGGQRILRRGCERSSAAAACLDGLRHRGGQEGQLVLLNGRQTTFDLLVRSRVKRSRLVFWEEIANCLQALFQILQRSLRARFCSVIGV